jgi:MinD superfamily P-loop ATPase
MVSDTRHGVLVHARLAIGSGNSGKLVSAVRDEARRRARESGARLVIVDGPPGIACPAIAAVTGATRVLAVTEPSVSGEHDLERLLVLAGHFAIPVSVCVNRWDVSPAMADRIERRALRGGAHLAGRVRHDRAVSRAQIAGRAVVEIPSAAADDVRAVWGELVTALEAPDGRARGGREDERCPVVGGFA